MQKGYFAAAWGDITQSPGWVSKFARLGLLLLIPIFGVIVMYGYLYAWARDIAWNVHRPLPDHIFGNEDGRLYSRGFFVLVVAFVFSLVPGFVGGLFSFSAGMTTLFWPGDYIANALVVGLGSGLIISLLALVLSFVATFFIWVGSMRVAIYGTLSAGFQVRKIWAMIRYDFMGLLRIFGMALICDLVIAFIAGVIGFVLVLFVSVVGFSAATLLDDRGAVFFLILFCLVVGVFFLVVALGAGVLVEALIARALGYWTRQFEVAQWGGQDDPMPFEQRFAAASAGQSQPQQPSQQAQSAQHTQQQTQQQAYWSQPSPQPVQSQPYWPSPSEQPNYQEYAPSSLQVAYQDQQPSVVQAQFEGQPTQNIQGQAVSSSDEVSANQQPPVIDIEPSNDIINALSSDEKCDSAHLSSGKSLNDSSDQSLDPSPDESTEESSRETSESSEDKTV